MTETFSSETASMVVPRPQPIGVFPLPAGYLLVDEGPGHDEVRSQLVAAKLPAEFPPTLSYYQHALRGEIDAALSAIEGDDVVANANRFVLDPSPTRLTALNKSVAELDEPDRNAMAAYVTSMAYVVGLDGELPDAKTTDGEFAALAHSIVAAWAIENSDRARAIDELEAAAQASYPISKPMAGQLLGQLANAQLDEGGTQRAGVSFQAAIDAMADTDLHLSRAELHVAAGAMFQEMSESAPRIMAQAINHYHQALALVTSETAPETFAVANANLGLAYLMSPMHEASDQLRMGVAVQSLREALNVFSPTDDLQRWSSTQLNLANALVYLPSSHQADNIAEAVGLYEGVLQQRSRQSDPLGRARVLANQGNALAHLGVFDDAKSKLHEARSIFEEFDETDSVQMIRSILDEIAKQESVLRQDARS